MNSLVNVGDQVQPAIQISDKLGVECALAVVVLLFSRFMPVNYTSIIRNLRDVIHSARPL